MSNLSLDTDFSKLADDKLVDLVRVCHEAHNRAAGILNKRLNEDQSKKISELEKKRQALEKEIEAKMRLEDEKKALDEQIEAMKKSKVPAIQRLETNAHVKKFNKPVKDDSEDKQEEEEKSGDEEDSGSDDDKPLKKSTSDSKPKGTDKGGSAVPDTAREFMQQVRQNEKLKNDVQKVIYETKTLSKLIKKTCDIKQIRSKTVEVIREMFLALSH